MKKTIAIAAAIVGVCALGACSQWATRNFGGTTNIDLPPGEHLVNVTWEKEDLWYLTRPRHDDEKQETSTLRESSQLGIVSGTVVFHEH